MIRWLWSNIMKWGWDFNRNLREDDIHVPFARQPGGHRLRSQEIGCDPEIDLTRPINFSVQQVEGGTLIQTRWYDEKKDKHDCKLHIVTQDQNLAEAIGKIVTMELLKR